MAAVHPPLFQCAPMAINDKAGIGIHASDLKRTPKGNIHAQAIKVNLSLPGLDYVFKESYDLKSWEEVQNHIQEHGHFPNIPSAKGMEANVIELGEMNMKLLEKIEELTLYVLDLEKENKKIKKEISQMQNLEKRLQKVEVLIEKITS